jgi:MFS family permease
MDRDKQNMAAFLWHAALLAVTTTFTDINTVFPALIMGMGGTKLHLGILTGIMVGIPLAGQLLFAGFLHTKPRKKPYLLMGIFLRVLALILLTLFIMRGESWNLRWLLSGIYSALLVFTLGGAFAGISYMDLVGKSFPGEMRRIFVLRRQGIIAVGVLISALLTRLIMGRTGNSYSLLFGLSALALLLASAGFLSIHEQPRPREQEKQSALKIIGQIPAYLKADPTLARYIVTGNLLGLGTVLLPFYMALAKDTYRFDGAMTGNLILVQIGGMILSNLLWRRIVRKGGFKPMLRIWGLLGFATPPLALAASFFLPFRFFIPVFLLTGFYLGAQKVTSDAVLMEISNGENRALYTGIFGTFNITLALFPIISGGLIGITGYLPVMVFTSLAAGTSLFFIRKMICPVDKTE